MTELRSKFREPYWHWLDEDSDIRVGTIRVDTRVSLTELIEHVSTLSLNCMYADVWLNPTRLTWREEASAEDIEKRQARRTNSEGRRERWEREAAAELVRKHPEIAARTLDEMASYE